MMVQVEVDDVRECSTDDRGRFYLGKEYSNEIVEIAVLGVKDE